MIEGHKIKYLEGLRGLAALAVILHHFLVAFYPLTYYGGNTPSHLGNIEMLYFQSPLSFFTNGNFMVAIFFVLSGYVLSDSYFKRHDTETLTSAAVRRFPRLYIPVAFTLIIAYLLIRFSLIPYSQTAGITHSKWMMEIWPTDMSFTRFLKSLVYGTMFNGDFTYDTTMWTMSIELYGSMLVFALLFLTHGAKAKWIFFAFTSAIVCYFFSFFYISFIIGISLHYLPTQIKYQKMIVVVLLVIGAILGGYPSWQFSYNNETFYKLIPTALFNNNPAIPHVIGAACILAAILLSPRIQRLLSGKVFTFLGEISFSSYLIHPLLIGSISSWLFLSLNNYTSNYNLAVLVTVIVSIPVILLVSKAMTEWIDKPGIRLSKYIYSHYFKRTV